MATKSTKSRRRVLKGRKRPIGLEGSATRALLLDAAERLMLDEGYAAVTTRRLGAYAHINPQLVHYYFPSLDDLFIALLQRRTADHLKTVKETLASDRPFRAFWLMSRDPTDAGITAELNALSRHRKALRAKIRAHAEEVRSLQHAGGRIGRHVRPCPDRGTRGKGPGGHRGREIHPVDQFASGANAAPAPEEKTTCDRTESKPALMKGFSDCLILPPGKGPLQKLAQL